MLYPLDTSSQTFFYIIQMSVSQIVLFSCGSKEHCKARNELKMEDYDTLTFLQCQVKGFEKKNEKCIFVHIYFSVYTLSVRICSDIYDKIVL